jgi:hypothetical protein
MKLIGPEGNQENLFKEKPIEKKFLPFKIIYKQRGLRSWFTGLRKNVDTNMEVLIEWNESGKREYISKRELKKLMN